MPSLCAWRSQYVAHLMSVCVNGVLQLQRLQSEIWLVFFFFSFFPRTKDIAQAYTVQFTSHSCKATVCDVCIHITQILILDLMCNVHTRRTWYIYMRSLLNAVVISSAIFWCPRLHGRNIKAIDRYCYSSVRVASACSIHNALCFVPFCDWCQTRMQSILENNFLTSWQIELCSDIISSAFNT